MIKAHVKMLKGDVDGVELADSWYDWINARFLGYRDPNRGASDGPRGPTQSAGKKSKPLFLRSSRLRKKVFRRLDLSPRIRYLFLSIAVAMMRLFPCIMTRGWPR